MPTTRKQMRSAIQTKQEKKRTLAEMQSQHPAEEEKAPAKSKKLDPETPKKTKSEPKQKSKKDAQKEAVTEI